MLFLLYRKVYFKQVLLTKECFFGTVLWFLLTGFGTMWRLPVFHEMPTYAAYSSLIGALIYGIALAYSMKLLEKYTDLL